MHFFIASNLKVKYCTNCAYVRSTLLDKMLVWYVFYLLYVKEKTALFPNQVGYLDAASSTSDCAHLVDLPITVNYACAPGMAPGLEAEDLGRTLQLPLRLNMVPGLALQAITAHQLYYQRGADGPLPTATGLPLQEPAGAF